MESISNELESLKLNSVKTFESVGEARSLMEDIRDLKLMITETIKGVANSCIFLVSLLTSNSKASERFLGQGSGEMACDSSKMREIFTELKLDNQNSKFRSL